MSVFATALPTFLVLAIYTAYDTYRRDLLRRDRILRHRVAYMLWVMAQRLC